MIHQWIITIETMFI